MGSELSQQQQGPAGRSALSKGWSQTPPALENHPHHSRVFAHSKSLDLDPQSRGARALGFSDYNFYPDRFNHELKKVPEEEQQLHPQFRGLFSPPRVEEPSGSSPELEEGAELLSRRVDLNPSISKYNFRIRTFSDSNPIQLQPAPDHITNPREPRRRSNSLSSSYYYFDFSCIPEKDPRCAKDEEERKRRIRNASQGEDDHPAAAAARLNATAAREKKAGLAGGVEPAHAPMPPPPRRKMSSPQQQYGFFDYSMIPDKMMGSPPARKPEV